MADQLVGPTQGLKQKFCAIGLVSDLAWLSQVHPPVIEGVGGSQVLEHVIVWCERGGGEGGREDGVGRVVEGVGGDQGAAVDVAGQHELDLGDPLLDGLGLGLRPLVVLLEVVGVVAVQIEAAGVVPACETKYDVGFF